MEETKGSKRKGENRKRFPNGEEEGGRQRGERPEQRTQRDAQRSREEDEGDREILEPLQCKTLLHLQRFLQDSALFFKTSGVVLYFVILFLC